MIQTARHLSPDQRTVIEGLLGRAISDDEQISLRTVPATPEWLRSIQRDAGDRGVDALSMEEIDAEIDAARRERRARGPKSGK
jgi:hypothetical protein